jgi:hypothetical protein
MSPAGSAVGWDVLVSHVGEVVGSIDVVPEPLFWDVFEVLEWLGDLVLDWNSWLFVAWEVWVDELEGLLGEGDSDDGS